MKLDLFIAQFPYGGRSDTETTDYVQDLVRAARRHPLVGKIHQKPYNDTPITMTRNRAMLEAELLDADLMLMVDSDMVPDLYLGQPGVPPFFEHAITTWQAVGRPCAIAAPYCGPPPHENVYVFCWRNFQSDCPDPNYKIEQFTREEAAYRSGVEQVAALATGLILIDMRVAKMWPKAKPFFEYEYTDERCHTKHTTEDAYFTRQCSLLGIPQYVLWDCWAGHSKRKVVGKPRPTTCDILRKDFADAIKRGVASDDRLVMVGETNRTTVLDRVQAMERVANGKPTE